MLTVTTVGTGTAFPEATRGPSCNLLTFADGAGVRRRVVVDMGSGALQKLAARGVTPLSVDAVLLTHAHLDHLSDVLPMLFALGVPGYGRPAPLKLLASPETHQVIVRVDAALGGWLSRGESQIELVTIDPSTTEGETLGLYDMRVDSWRVAHTASSIGFRFEHPSGATLALPGDSEKCPGLVAVCRDVDLAVVELSMPEVMPLEGHLHPSALSDVVRLSGLRRLAVVHRYPAALANDAVDAVRAQVGVEVIVPNDGDVLQVGPGAGMAAGD